MTVLGHRRRLYSDAQLAEMVKRPIPWFCISGPKTIAQAQNAADKYNARRAK